MAAPVITPFQVSVSAEEVKDLRDRLARTRWTDQLPDAGWNYGTELGFLRRLCDYWRDDYDFDGYVRRLNAYPQFLAEIGGEQIQFYHVRSSVPTAKPLVLIHGWPGSVIEFLDLIGRLTEPEDPADAFHVVVPSLPGYGYSGPTRSQYVDIDRAAEMIKLLMAELGYPRYFAQGGDWGAITTSRMAETYPDNVSALHVNMAPGGPDDPSSPMEGLSEQESQEWSKFLRFLQADAGYSHIQMTRPQTLAVGINDSPAGLAAWIIDKFHAWTDHGGDLQSVFDFQHLTDNLTLYWLTGTAGSSFRLYFESNGRGNYRQSKVKVPTGIARFAGEPFRWPRRFVEMSYHNIQDWQELPKGGHFAAFQRPDDFLRVVRGFFRAQADLI